MSKPRIVFWVVLALPGIAAFAQLTSGANPGDLLHGSGESSARLMIIALLLTPLRLLFPNVRVLTWLRQHRRDLGIAAFAYALLHTVLYLFDKGALSAVVAELGAIGIWTGWAALAIFIPLALTSNDLSARRLGPNWRALHRTAYIAAVLTLVHWIYVQNNIAPALVHFVPLAGLEIYRVLRARQDRRQSQA